MKFPVTRSPLLACALALVTFDAAAAEWFVSPAGNDASGNGSLAAPFRTLAHTLAPANAIVAAGDTVTLRGPVGNNVFAECEVRLRVRLTLRSFAGERAHVRCDIPPDFDPNLDDETVAVQIDPEASGSRLSNLEISGSTLYGVFLQTDWEQGSNEAGSGPTDVILEDLHLHDTGRDAIKITPHSDRVTIRRNLIERTGRIYPPGTDLYDKNAEGIDNVNGSGMVVEDNRIRDTATTGLYFKGGAADVIVRRNVIEHAGEFGIAVGFDTSPEFFDLDVNPDYYESLRATVINNLVLGSVRAGITLWSSRDALVANNTVTGAQGLESAALFFGVATQDFAAHLGRPANNGHRIVNNIFRSTGPHCVTIRWANEDLTSVNSPSGLYGLVGVTGMDNNAFENSAGPCVFVDQRPGSVLDVGGDFSAWKQALNTDANSVEGAVALTADGHLAPGSLAIDRGQNVPQVGEDIDREPRVLPYDIGADELDTTTVFRHGFESP